MESKRQQKFARVIQKDLGDIFQREAPTLLPGVLITITQLRVTPDLSLARVYLSFFNTKDPQGALNTIRTQSREVRFKLASRIKDQVRAIPVLEFFLDDTNDYTERMDRIFDQLHERDKEKDSDGQ